MKSSVAKVDAALAAALKWLASALDRAPDPKRASRLALWADSDPSLAPLRYKPGFRNQFDDLLSRYREVGASPGIVVFQVTPQGDEWITMRDDTQLGTFATKEEALDAAVEIAKQSRPSRLIVRRANGTFHFGRRFAA
jgi:hypothetical protein